MAGNRNKPWTDGEVRLYANLIHAGERATEAVDTAVALGYPRRSGQAVYDALIRHGFSAIAERADRWMLALDGVPIVWGDIGFVSDAAGLCDDYVRQLRYRPHSGLGSARMIGCGEAVRNGSIVPVAEVRRLVDARAKWKGNE